MEQAQEIEIVRRYRSGETEAFGEVFDAYSRSLYGFIYCKVHHRPTAEDILSQTFLKAVQAFGRFDPERGRVASWLFRIARNTVIDHYRSAVPGISLEDAWGLSDPASAEVDADLHLKLEEVREHLRKLAPLEREVITMRVWQEMSHAEIALVIGKTEGNSKVIFSRAVAKLRESMPLAMYLAFLLN